MNRVRLAAAGPLGGGGGAEVRCPTRAIGGGELGLEAAGGGGGGAEIRTIGGGAGGALEIRTIGGGAGGGPETRTIGGGAGGGLDTFTIGGGAGGALDFRSGSGWFESLNPQCLHRTASIGISR